MFTSGQATGQSLGVARVSAQGDFPFGCALQEFMPERVQIGRVSDGWQVDASASELRMFAEDDSEKANGGSLGYGGGSHITAGGLGAARH